MKNYGKAKSLLILVLIVITVFSCVPVKEVSYFNDLDKMQEPVANPRIQKTILPFDRLYVKVLSTDPQTSQIFSSREETYNSNQGNSLLSYFVDESGNIDFPFVGKIKVGSLTCSVAASRIQKSLNEYVSNAYVTVKFIDNQVSVLGEVENQGVFAFSQDKLNIYEALALGGGITRYGNRKNIILIRQDGDKILHHKLNLSDSKISGKDYYYVQANDVIIVEPLKSVSTSYINNTYITILSSITTLTAVLLLMTYFQ